MPWVLNDDGQARAAIEALETSIQVHPYDRNSLAALASFLKQAGNPLKALGYAQRLEKLEPDNPEVRMMVKELSGYGHH